MNIVDFSEGEKFAGKPDSESILMDIDTLERLLVEQKSLKFLFQDG